jgi:hypothetical protein
MMRPPFFFAGTISKFDGKQGQEERRNYEMDPSAFEHV